jgi:hypothetical protein
MISGLCLTMGFAAIAIAAFFIWLRQSRYWLSQSNFLSDENDRYRQDRLIFHYTKKCLNYLYKESRSLRNAPELAENILRRMKLLLPPKAILSEQRVHLQNITLLLYKKHLVHHARQSSLSAEKHTPTPALANNINKLSSVKNRLNKLDMAAQEQEKKIQCLLQLAQNFAAVRRIRQFRTCIKVAKEFQDSNISLLNSFRQTEKRLFTVSRNFDSIKKRK